MSSQINYTKVDIRGKAVAPVLEAILFQNNTLKKGYVKINEGVKADTIISSVTMNATAQLYTGDKLTADGDTTIVDEKVTPVKLEYKLEFNPEALRFGRANLTMKPGAINTGSEFDDLLLNHYAKAVAQDQENQFWKGITSATKSAIAGLTPNAAQGSITAAAQTQIATLTAGNIDGVLPYIIYNNGALGTYKKVTGTTVTSSNIYDEYIKIYNALDSELLDSSAEPVVIWAPREDRQLMRSYNSIPTNYRGAFAFESDANDSRVFFNGVEIFFVPLPTRYRYANVMDAVSFNTDSSSDVSAVIADKKWGNEAEIMFLRVIYTMNANVALIRQPKGVLYGG